MDVDGRRCGELKFPGGELELTSLLQPGKKQTLSLLIEAMPLKAVGRSNLDSERALSSRYEAPAQP